MCWQFVVDDNYVMCVFACAKAFGNWLLDDIFEVLETWASKNGFVNGLIFAVHPTKVAVLATFILI